MMNYLEFIEKYATHPNYKAPTGGLLHAKSWQTEAPLRMLLNNLDRQVAENPEELVVYGGTGQADRNPSGNWGQDGCGNILSNAHNSPAGTG